MNFQHYTHHAIVFDLYAIFFFIVVTYSFFELAIYLKASPANRRKQDVAMVIATLIAFSGGSMTFIPVYDISLPQYGIFAMIFYPFIMGYAIIRQGLLEPEEALALHREKLVLMGLLNSSINHEIKTRLSC